MSGSLKRPAGEAPAEEREKLKMWEESSFTGWSWTASTSPICSAKYHTRLLPQDDRRRTVRLPHGTMAIRKLPDKWEIDPDPLPYLGQGDACCAGQGCRVAETRRGEAGAQAPVGFAEVPLSDRGRVGGWGRSCPGVAVIERQVYRWSVTVESRTFAVQILCGLATVCAAPGAEAGRGREACARPGWPGLRERR